MKSIWAILLLFGSLFGNQNDKPYVIAKMTGQLGNNMFQVATAQALAWDNQAEAYFPDLDPRSLVYRHVFFRCKHLLPKRKVRFQWKEPNYAYNPIPYQPDMRISGYFQTEKYFKHHREQILELFSPHPDDRDYIQKKYASLIAYPETVGVQIRYYKAEFPNGGDFPQYGKEYLEKAMALFPESSLFVISSNNLDFARKNIPSWVKNVVFIQNEPPYVDLHLLSLCKHNIITNSSFGWWAAWLNQNPKKIVVKPSVWILGLPTQDVCPSDWIEINAKYE